MFSLGVITGTHGIKGYIKVFPFTDDVMIFKSIKSLYVELNNQPTDKLNKLKEFEIRDVKYVKKYALLKLDGIDTMDEAMSLKGFKVKVSDEFVRPLEKDEYFARDLYGMDVVTDTGEMLGEITDILFTGANDVYVVGKELMIPAIKQCILDIDVINKKMTVRLLEGLR